MRNRFARVAVLVLIGCIGLISISSRPRFQALHTVDVLQLIASGMCFGVALALLLAFRKRR